MRSRSTVSRLHLGQRVTIVTTNLNVDGDNTFLKQGIVGLLHDRYLNAHPLIDRELALCDRAYYVMDEIGLMSFFLIKRHTLNISGQDVPAVYLGLSGTRPGPSGTETIREIYRHFRKEALDWQGQQAKDSILWATTATPTAYLTANNLFANLEPRIDGSYSHEALGILKAIKGDYFPTAAEEKNPFLIRQVSPTTRYSEKEDQRLKELTERKQFSLFSELSLSEQNGDQLIMVMSLPKENQTQITLNE